MRLKEVLRTAVVSVIWISIAESAPNGHGEGFYLWKQHIHSDHPNRAMCSEFRHFSLSQ